MTPLEVVRWARRHSISWRNIAHCYRSAVRSNFTSLLQAIWREAPPTHLKLCGAGNTFRFEVMARKGRTNIPITGLPHYGRFELGNWPSVADSTDLKFRTGRSLRLLLSDICKSYPHGTTAEILLSFDNSVANGTLDALRSGTCNPRSPEPVYCGNLHHPFPSYRGGLTIEDVGLCTPLSEGCEVQLIKATSETAEYFGQECDDELTAFRYGSSGYLIPVHPWQIKYSRPLKAALADGRLSIAGSTRCFPLASQRTVRTETASLDLKLPVDVQLLGARRLLSRATIREAPAISAAVDAQASRLGEALVFDLDIASLAVSDSLLDGHFGCIMRRPAIVTAQERIVPASLLWHSPSLFRWDREVQLLDPIKWLGISADIGYSRSEGAD
jgi:hypothetical protein